MMLVRCARCGGECSPGPIISCVKCGLVVRPFVAKSKGR